MRRVLSRMELYGHALGRAAQQYFAHRAPRVALVSVDGDKRKRLDDSPAYTLPAAVDSYAQTYGNRAARPAGNTMPDPLTLCALEDMVIEVGLLIDSADAYYYGELTPQLERDAQYAAELQAKLLEHRHEAIWARR